jgi:glycosyltransferase involved in cell wall biosynthesis
MSSLSTLSITEKKSKKNILFLSLHSKIAPGTYYRIAQYLPLYEKQGITPECITFFKGKDEALLQTSKSTFLSKIILNIKKIGVCSYRLPLWLYHVIPKLLGLSKQKYKLIYIYKNPFLLSSHMAWILLSYSKIPFIMDIDDDVKSERAYFCYTNLLKKAKRVVVGNSVLFQDIKKYNSKITVIPTAINMNIYDKKEEYNSSIKKDKRYNKQIVLGWIGSRTTIPFIKKILPVIHKIGKKRNIVLHLVGPSSLKSIKSKNILIKYYPWSRKNEIDNLGVFSIGLYPMPNTHQAKRKSGLKAIQYHALGIPCLISPSGSRYVNHGIDGYICKNKNEWEERIIQLCNNSSLRKKMGLAGKKKIIKKYNSKDLFMEYVRLFNSIINKSK